MKWSLRKTLSRNTSFRPIEKEDLPYLWATYRLDGLADIGLPDGLDRDTFTAEIVARFDTVYHGVWTLFADTKKGHMPAGVVAGFWSHPDPTYAPFMHIGAMVWFPWSTPRNRVEAAVRFFNETRKEFPLMEYARDGDRKFFDMIARHGIMRRVGTSYNVYAGEKAAIYETRKP